MKMSGVEAPPAFRGEKMVVSARISAVEHDRRHITKIEPCDTVASADG